MAKTQDQQIEEMIAKRYIIQSMYDVKTGMLKISLKDHAKASTRTAYGHVNNIHELREVYSEQCRLLDALGIKDGLLRRVLEDVADFNWGKEGFPLGPNFKHYTDRLN